MNSFCKNNNLLIFSFAVVYGFSIQVKSSNVIVHSKVQFGEMTMRNIVPHIGIRLSFAAHFPFILAHIFPSMDNVNCPTIRSCCFPLDQYAQVKTSIHQNEFLQFNNILDIYITIITFQSFVVVISLLHGSIFPQRVQCLQFFHDVLAESNHFVNFFRILFCAVA